MAHSQTSSDDVKIDLGQLLWEVRCLCDPDYSPQKKNPPIYRLPKSTKRFGQSFYSPQTVKLGLLNNDKMNWPFSQIEEKKVEAVSRTVQGPKRTRIPNLVKEIDQLKIGKYYGEKYSDHADDDDGLEYIRGLFDDVECIEAEAGPALSCFMDGCFILDFFSNRNIGVMYSFQQRDILDDIFKLENQIPLVVLVKILELEYGNPEDAKSNLADRLCKDQTFQKIPFSLKSTGDDLKEEIDNAHHLLDLVRRMVVRYLTKDSPEAQAAVQHDNQEYHYLQSAENLIKHGIKLEPSEKGEVKFEKRWLRQSILWLPKITVDHNTEGLIRNLMAFDCEQQTENEKERAIICQLMILMDCLIETGNDIAILKKKRILVSRIGSDEGLAVMFNNLCKGTPDSIPYYNEEVRKLNKHCRKKLKTDQWISWCKEYFSKPWNIISLIVAAIILVFTITQTYYTVIQTNYTVKGYDRDHPN